MPTTEIYMATVLLEPNRWRADKTPSFAVSDWIERFADAGFDGIELWENHAALATATERDRLARSVLPIAVFNSYAHFGRGDADARDKAAQFAAHLGAGRIKFNIGNDPAQYDTYVQNVLRWGRSLPAGIRPLCECHPGTLVEKPEAAAEAFAVWQQVGAEAVIHPFNLQPHELKSWFRHLGPAITHAHVQLHRGGKMQKLQFDEARVADNVRIMREAGFTGTFSIEFTGGVAATDEDMNALFAAAVDDLNLLRQYV